MLRQQEQQALVGVPLGATRLSNVTGNVEMGTGQNEASVQCDADFSS